jgi:hypothetical protein
VRSNSKIGGHTAVLEDIALWPDALTSDTTEQYLVNEPENVGSMDTLSKEHKHGNVMYNRGLRESYFLRITKKGTKHRQNGSFCQIAMSI